MTMPIASYKESESWHAWSPKFIVDYRFNSSVLSYASVARGYKAGGFQATAADTPDIAKLDPEYVWSYEAGFKTNWLEDKLIINAAGFYSKVEDCQVWVFSGITNLTELSNAAKATIWGFEVELLARPISGLDIMASFGYLNTEFDEYEDPFHLDFFGNPDPQDYKGKKLPLAPEYDLSLAAQYRFPWGLYSRAEYHHLGDTYYNPENTLKQASYGLVNAKIGYEQNHWDIYFFINNILDKEYYPYLFGPFTNPSEVVGVISDPRTFGAMATLRF